VLSRKRKGKRGVNIEDRSSTPAVGGRSLFTLTSTSLAAAMTSSSRPYVIDAFTHFACPEFTDYLESCTSRPFAFRALFDRIPELTDVAARIRYMDDLGVDQHCLVPLPWLECEPEVHGNVERAVQACRVANDAMSALVSAHPSRFVGVALVPTGSAEAMVAELDRSVLRLGLSGVALFCGPTVKPLDDPSFEPLYRRCAELSAPIWVHPCRPQSYADYEAYASRGSLHQIWNTLGWIYDTSVSMVHMALAGVFQRYPHLKVVTHHHGGMIPFFTERFDTQRRNFDEDEGEDLLRDLRKFYCDTATFGVSPANVKAALDFFEEGRVLFGSDTPMDMGRRGFFTQTALESVALLPGATEAEREAILSGNATRMLQKVKLTQASL
jgi:predicted TIM-barrel fold metal-dependent hydrolase